MTENIITLSFLEEGGGGGRDGTYFNHPLVFTLLQCFYTGLGSKPKKLRNVLSFFEL